MEEAQVNLMNVEDRAGDDDTILAGEEQKALVDEYGSEDDSEDVFD